MTTAIRDHRVEIRTTADEQRLLDQAAAVNGTTRSAFVLDHAIDAARRALADRTSFQLNGDALEAWEALNDRPARDLPGLRALFERPDPFEE